MRRQGWWMVGVGYCGDMIDQALALARVLVGTRRGP